MKKLSFTPMEKRICAGCFFSYLLAYVGRLNLAGALPHLSAALALTEAQAGLIPAVFAAVYAVGQLVNGLFVSRVSSRRHVALGLLLSALCNLLFGCARAYWQLLALWALNGAAQSMLWTPIVRLMAAWYAGEKRARVAFLMCVCFIVGHLAAWALSGLLCAWAGWRLAFLVPAALLALTAAFAYAALRDREEPAAARPAPSVKGALLGAGLIWVFLAAVATGFARDGVMAWAPAMIGAVGGGALSGAAASLLIPALDLLGVLLAHALLARPRARLRRVICLLLLAACACCAALSALSAPSALGLALLMGTLCSLMYAVSTLQSVVLPLAWADTGSAALVAGACDCMLYLGSALVSVSSGALLQSAGRSAVYLCWGGAALLACLFMLRGAKK